MSGQTPVEVRVWGDFACFTRPEMKVERVSYELPPPSAARGILEAIFWKPEFFWQIREITLLSPIRRMSILRNEVNSKLTKNAQKEGFVFLADQDRAQRHALVLRDVHFIIRAEPVPHNGSGRDWAKFRDQFRRRVRRGQCAWQPYLGCREFSAFFSEPTGEELPLSLNMELGRMLFEIRYGAKGVQEPLFFDARLSDGTLCVPEELYEELMPRSRRK